MLDTGSTHTDKSERPNPKGPRYEKEGYPLDLQWPHEGEVRNWHELAIARGQQKQQKRQPDDTISQPLTTARNRSQPLTTAHSRSLLLTAAHSRSQPLTATHSRYPHSCSTLTAAHSRPQPLTAAHCRSQLLTAYANAILIIRSVPRPYEHNHVCLLQARRM